MDIVHGTERQTKKRIHPVREKGYILDQSKQTTKQNKDKTKVLHVPATSVPQDSKLLHPYRIDCETFFCFLLCRYNVL